MDLDKEDLKEIFEVFIGHEFDINGEPVEIKTGQSLRKIANTLDNIASTLDEISISITELLIVIRKIEQTGIGTP